MTNKSEFAGLCLAISLALSACASPGESAPPAGAPTETEAAPIATLGTEPTPTVALLDLEILEWFEHVVPNRVDPSNTDTVVEVLIHNPNNFPVRVNRDGAELSFLNLAGEVVSTAKPFFWYIWQGEWMTPGQTAALSTGACFYSCGLETQEWESLELTAPLEIATGPAYTGDVEFTAEFVLLEEVLHGYEGPGVATTLANTSNQVLESIATLVFAYDANGRFVGTAAFGNAVASFTENIGIQPGDTTSGFEVSEINYMGNERLTFEVQAIGIIAVAPPTPGAPEGTPSADWHGVPIMPGATNGGEADDGYTFSTQASSEEIVQFYEAALAGLGYSLITSGEQSGVTFLFFESGSSQAVVAIMAQGESNLVQLVVTP
jgi:hypothetical protein